MITDRSYIGANTRFTLDGAGIPIIALESNADASQAHHRIGDRVPFGIDLSHAALVVEAPQT